MSDYKWVKMNSEEGVLFSKLVEVLSPELYSDLMTYIDEYAQEVYWEAFDEGYIAGHNDGENGKVRAEYENRL